MEYAKSMKRPCACFLTEYAAHLWNACSYYYVVKLQRFSIYGVLVQYRYVVNFHRNMKKSQSGSHMLRGSNRHRRTPSTTQRMKLTVAMAVKKMTKKMSRNYRMKAIK